VAVEWDQHVMFRNPARPGLETGSGSDQGCKSERLDLMRSRACRSCSALSPGFVTAWAGAYCIRQVMDCDLRVLVNAGQTQNQCSVEAAKPDT
jgi:hypothetical protein